MAREEELNEIKNYYALSCPICGSENISISVRDKVTVECGSCSNIWNGAKELTEETGPRLAELLTIKRNKGIWKARWGILSSRTGTVFSALTAARKTNLETKKKQTIKAVQAKEKPECPKCGSPMKLVIPRPVQRWKKFWGCTKYPSRGCRGSRRA